MAAKLARSLYQMLRRGMQFVDRGAKFYEAQHRKRQIIHLKWKAAKLGLQITVFPQPKKQRLVSGESASMGHVIAATGYRLDTRRYRFFSPAIQQGLKTVRVTRYWRAAWNHPCPVFTA
jgi:hypothetical protein